MFTSIWQSKYAQKFTFLVNTIQTVNSPMYDTHMSTPGNTAKPRATHRNIQTAQRGPSLVGTRTYNALVSTPLSQYSTH